jgi:PPOX class probable F420-dependent enzyme
VDVEIARSRLTSARVGYLATVTAVVRAHVVPCCFALDGDTLYSAVDAKPKSTLDLRRVQNIRSNGAVSLLVDHYDDADWSQLWWVRVDGNGRTADDAVERARAIALLSTKYEQYRVLPPPGPVLAVDIDRWRTWP